MNIELTDLTKYAIPGSYGIFRSSSETSLIISLFEKLDLGPAGLEFEFQSCFLIASILDKLLNQNELCW